MDSLKSAQLAFQEAQSRIEELSMELRLAQSSRSTNTVRASMAAVGEEVISTDYGCEQVEDVVTSITVTGAVVTDGMSALVKSCREPHDTPSSFNFSLVSNPCLLIFNSCLAFFVFNIPLLKYFFNIFTCQDFLKSSLRTFNLPWSLSICFFWMFFLSPPCTTCYFKARTVFFCFRNLAFCTRHFTLFSSVILL